MKYLNKGINFLKTPSATFDKEKTTSLGEAFKYMLVMGIIVAVLGGTVGILTTSYIQSLFGIPVSSTEFLPMIILVGIVGGYLGLMIGNIIFSLWLHLWVYLLGAKKGLEQTMKSVFYGDTPYYLIGWIPLINIIALIWSVVLSGIGLTRLHGITGGKAALAIIISIVIPLIVIALVAAAAWFYLSGLVSGLGSTPGY
jgi:hypothetical protein